MEAIITKEFIDLGMQIDQKEAVINHLSELLVKGRRITDKATYVNAVMEREAMTSTAIGLDVGIPHGKSHAVKSPTIVFGRSESGIVWNEDGEKVKLVFLLAIPEKDAGNRHLKILAKLSRKLLDDEFLQFLKVGDSSEEILGMLEKTFSSINE